MKPMYLVMIAVAVALAGCIAALVWMRKAREKQQLMVRRLRSSGMYAGVYAMFLSCRDSHVESVTITAEEVSITLLHPQGKTLRYRFEAHGTDVLTPGTLSALAQAAQMDLPCLRDNRYYTFRRLWEDIGAAEKRRYYQYTIRQDRKDYLLHAIREKNRQITH